MRRPAPEREVSSGAPARQRTRGRQDHELANVTSRSARLDGERLADLPIADFDGASTSHLVGMVAASLAECALPESGWAHRHTYYEIAFIAAGRGTHVIDCRPYPLQPSTLYFLRPDQVHSWNYGHRGFPAGYVLGFSEEFLLSQPHNAAVSRNPELFNDLAAAAALPLTAAQTRRVLPIIRSIVSEYRAARPDYRSVMQAHLHILLALVHRMLPADAADFMPASRSDSLVRRFTELVSEHVAPRQSVRDCSRELGVTAGHLAATVRAATGHSPGEIIRRTQTVEAQRLLVHTDLNIAEIAYELGFGDAAYFARFFKRESGLTPGAFRRGARR